MFDYYICGDYGPNDPDCNERVDAAGDACQCIGVTFNKWNTFYDNCQGDPRSEKFSEDKCINMATQDTPGVSNFVMGRFADETNVYNPRLRWDDVYDDGGFTGFAYAPGIGTTECTEGEHGGLCERDGFILKM